MSTFAEWIAEFGEGSLDDELTAHLMEVATAVRLHGKQGSLTLKLKFSEKGGGVIVDADVASTAPQTKPSAFFYVDEQQGRLSRRDPRQPQIPGTEDPTKEPSNGR